MVLIGSALVPHGTMMLNPDKEGLPDGARELHIRTMEMMQRVVALSPSVLLLVTPHGMCAEKSIGVYSNRFAAGTASWNGHWADYKVEAELDVDLSQQLIKTWRGDGVDVQGVNQCTMGVCSLCWAEVVPLWMLQRCGFQGKIVIISMPHWPRYGGMSVNPDHLDNLYLAGQKLAEYCEGGMLAKEQVFMAVTGDLAHSHPTSFPDPLYLPDPNWTLPPHRDAGEEFDRRFERWALEKRRGRSLAGQCLALERDALSCALAGCLLMEGALHRHEQRDRLFACKLYINRTPTYFTMMSCTFLPEE